MRSYGFIKSLEDKRDVIFGSSNPLPEEYMLSNVPGIYDQGALPICAAISLSTILNWQRESKGDKKKLDYMDIFNLREDKTMNGMIPRQALSALKKQGVEGYKIGSYARVITSNSAKAAVLLNGPVMVGLNAHDCDEFWKECGVVQGGHAVVFTGWNKDGFILQNSWGYSWGDGGTMLFPFEDWKYVLECWTIMI